MIKGVLGSILVWVFFMSFLVIVQLIIEVEVEEVQKVWV